MPPLTPGRTVRAQRVGVVVRHAVEGRVWLDEVDRLVSDVAPQDLEIVAGVEGVVDHGGSPSPASAGQRRTRSAAPGPSRRAAIHCAVLGDVELGERRATRDVAQRLAQTVGTSVMRR